MPYVAASSRMVFPFLSCATTSRTAASLAVTMLARQIGIVARGAAPDAQMIIADEDDVMPIVELRLGVIPMSFDADVEK